MLQNCPATYQGAIYEQEVTGFDLCGHLTLSFDSEGLPCIFKTVSHVSLTCSSPGRCPRAPGPADFPPLCRLEGDQANDYLCGRSLFRPGFAGSEWTLVCLISFLYLQFCPPSL